MRPDVDVTGLHLGTLNSKEEELQVFDWSVEEVHTDKSGAENGELVVRGYHSPARGR